MKSAVDNLRKRWFEVSLHGFVLGGVAAALLLLFAPIAQVQAVAALALATAVTGAGVSIIGLHAVAPERLRALRARIRRPFVSAKRLMPATPADRENFASA